MAKWTKVTPSDYGLEYQAKTVERATTIELEQGLRVQVLRIKTQAPETAIKEALESNGTWTVALVTSREQYTFAAVFHEE